ncbi:MAG TPA: DUF268 domain-containing protein [Aggregatilineaceae bacterium]|nr:DUF268 domain-containing protein [Aggregatilineaceae bacterium]
MKPFHHMQRLYRAEIKVRLPWYKAGLRARGEPFVRSYSSAGDAALTLWPCEGDADGMPAVVGDRHYEYAYTVDALLRSGLQGKNVLDIGSSGSFLPPIIAALGVKLTCVDVREWPMQWPGLCVVVVDLVDSAGEQALPIESFDGITCVSTLEHFGLGRYGDVLDVRGDITGMQRIIRFLKPGGLLFLTVPFGRAEVAYPAHRIYDRNRLALVTAGLELIEQRYFGPVSKPWVYQPCTLEQAEQIPPAMGYAVTGCILRKPGLTQH